MNPTTSSNPDPTVAITGEQIRPIVRRILNDPTATLQEWQQTPLHDAANTNTRIIRCQGTASQGQTSTPWSTVLKIIRRPAQAKTTGWQREAAVYHSGWLATLPPTFTAPTCYAQYSPAEDEIWLWLADINETSALNWTLDQFCTASHHLGQFNGACLVGGIPLQTWFSQHWLRQNLRAAEPGFQHFLNVSDQSLLRRGFSSYDVARIRPIWVQRTAFLTVLERLPQAICHYHTAPYKMAVTPEQTIAHDWSAVGPGPLGADPAALFWFGLVAAKLPVSHAQEYEQAIFEAYITGLRDTGWNGDIGQTRLAYVLVLLLRRLGTVGTIAQTLTRKDDTPSSAQNNRTIAEYIDYLATTHPFIHQLVTEGQTLLKSSA